MKMSDATATLVARSVDDLVAAFSEPVLVSLGGRFGLAPQILVELTRRTATVISIALMSRCIEPHQALLDAVMSPEANAHVHERLSELTETTAALKRLEGLGLALLTVALEREPAALSDIVSACTGVPTQAAHAWTGIAAAVFFGQLKRQMLLDQAKDTGGIQRSLLLQWPAVSGQADDALAVALGFEKRDALVAAVSGAQEKVVRQTPYSVVTMQPDGSSESIFVTQVRASSCWRGITIGCLVGAVVGASAMFALEYEGMSQMPAIQSVMPAHVAADATTVPSAASSVAPAAASPVAVASSDAAVAQASSPTAAEVSSSVQPNAAPANAVPVLPLPVAPPLPAQPAPSRLPAR